MSEPRRVGDEESESLVLDMKGEPRLSRTYSLTFVGDWGGANFHRICAWLTQAFSDRAGPGSGTSIRSLRDGGMYGISQVVNGEADLAIATPAGLMGKSMSGTAIFSKALPSLRALAVLPQNDRLVFAIDPKYGIKSFEDLRKSKPALRIATSTNDGSNFIGHVADEFLKAHGVSTVVISSWGGSFVRAHRPEQCTALVENGQADALLQEAIMTPWWRSLIESDKLVPLPAETEPLARLEGSLGLKPGILPAGYWGNLFQDLPALDFSDFVILVRDDLPKEVSYLLTWCLVETRHLIEAQYRHIPPVRSPLSYPLEPRLMAQSPIPLHPGAHEFYSKKGLL